MSIVSFQHVTLIGVIAPYQCSHYQYRCYFAVRSNDSFNLPLGLIKYIVTVIPAAESRRGSVVSPPAVGSVRYTCL